MKQLKKIASILTLLLLATNLLAQEGYSVKVTNPKKVRMVYDVDFQYYFDNREFTTGGEKFLNSMTINSARLTPSAGIEIRQSGTLEHRIMAGIDIMKNMGEAPVDDSQSSLNNWKLFREITLYYRIRAILGNTVVTGYAGIFPRSMTVGDYTPAFISDSLRHFDNNLEGILVQFHMPKGFCEVGLDWMGKEGEGRRERFMLYSYGIANVKPWFSAGWRFNGYHLANPTDAHLGVCDNVLAEPFVKFSYGKPLGLQELSAELGWMQGYQRDRLIDEKAVFPHGAELTLKAKKWNVGIWNTSFVGTGMMPYYNSTDVAGNKYGSLLYFGDPNYRLHEDSSMSTGFYDRMEIFWQPNIAEFVDLRLSAVMHFNEGGFQGWQQRLGIVVCLDRLLNGNKIIIRKNKKQKEKIYTL